MASRRLLENLVALAKHHPDAARRLREGLPEAPRPSLARSATGHAILRLGAQPLHSEHDPLAEAEAIVAGASLDQAHTILVYGFGTGHVLRETLARAGSNARVITLILDPGSFVVALESLDLRDLFSDSRLALALGTLRQIIATLPPESEDMRVVVHPPLLAAAPTSLAPLAHMAAELLTTQSSRLAQFGQVRENIARNLPLILEAEPVSVLAQALRGQPVLLVAPGPSLEEQLPRLARSKRPFLVALDTSLRVLLAVDIQPDLVITLDPLERNLAKFKGLEAELPIAFFESARPEIVRLSPRPLFACEAGGLLDRAHPFFGRAGRYTSEGSCLFAALDILLSMGTAQIGLTGADLAQTGGKSHAGRPESRSRTTSHAGATGSPTRGTSHAGATGNPTRGTSHGGRAAQQIDGTTHEDRVRGPSNGISYEDRSGSPISGRARDLPALDGGMTSASESLWLHRRRVLRRLEQEPAGRVVDLRAAGATLPGLARQELGAWLDDLDPEACHPALDTPTRLRQDADRSEAGDAARRALEASI